MKTGDDSSTRTPRSASSLSQKQLSYDQQLASQTLATFPLRNTSDAIRLLDQAKARSADRAQDASDAQENATTGRPDMFGVGSSGPRFFLLQEGYIDEATLFRLFSFYIGSVHPIMPLIPYKRMQITPEHILAMASREPHFMAAILVVTASLAGNQALHDRLWQRVQGLFAEVAMKGSNASLEVMEGLILLSGTKKKNLLQVVEVDLACPRISAKHGSQHRTRFRRPNVLDDCRYSASDALGWVPNDTDSFSSRLLD